MSEMRTCSVCGKRLSIGRFRAAGNPRFLRRQCKACESRRSGARRMRRAGLAIPDRLRDPELARSVAAVVENERRQARESGRSRTRRITGALSRFDAEDLSR